MRLIAVSASARWKMALRADAAWLKGGLIGVRWQRRAEPPDSCKLAGALDPRPGGSTTHTQCGEDRSRDRCGYGLVSRTRFTTGALYEGASRAARPGAGDQNRSVRTLGRRPLGTCPSSGLRVQLGREASSGDRRRRLREPSRQPSAHARRDVHLRSPSTIFTIASVSTRQYSSSARLSSRRSAWVISDPRKSNRSSSTLAVPPSPMASPS